MKGRRGKKRKASSEENASSKKNRKLNDGRKIRIQPHESEETTPLLDSAEDDLDQYPINPCILDPASVALCDPATDTLRSGQRVHGITVAKEGPLRDELFLFLPPGPGGTNRRLRLWAAAVGYRTISLGWINDADITSSCAQTGDTCYEAFRYEATYGLDTSPFIEVGEVDSIMHRLEVLLSYLAVEEPHRDWGRYLDEKGQVRWGEVVVVGWSIGGGQAAFLAKYHPVKGVLLFSGPKDRIHEPDTVASTWLRTPGVTEPCRHYGIFHLLEDGVAPPNAVLRQAWEELGLPFPEAPLLTADPAHQTFAVDDEGALRGPAHLVLVGAVFRAGQAQRIDDRKRQHGID